ncbi:MAG: DUF6088 family protein [Pseudomonadota bacterium]
MRIGRKTYGTPFVSSEFLSLGTRAVVDQTLSRLVRSGKIRRLSRGVFIRPAQNPYVGEVMPGVREIAERLAKQRGYRIQEHGSEIARKFGLSTQMAMQSIFLTNGPSRKIRMGNGEIQLKHVAERKLGPKNSKAGEVISLLWYLGKEAVGEGVLAKVKSRLSEEQLREVEEAIPSMPTWMAGVIRKSLSF